MSFKRSSVSVACEDRLNRQAGLETGNALQSCLVSGQQHRLRRFLPGSITCSRLPA